MSTTVHMFQFIDHQMVCKVCGHILTEEETADDRKPLPPCKVARRLQYGIPSTGNHSNKELMHGS